VLTLTNVGKTYARAGRDVRVLSHLSAAVARGETVAIVGPSGSGKSTLLALLAGLDRPSEGALEVCGSDLARLSEAELTTFRARHIGIVFQQFHLLGHLTAEENVALPLDIAGEAGARERAATLLGEVGLGERREHFPHELSGGECQRVAIARALIHAPPLLLADEPSGNLDVATGDQVMRLLFALVRARGTTLVLVTHNPELARACDRRLVLSGGRLDVG
jgi:putative ABC transport system ATP-binding protein